MLLFLNLGGGEVVMILLVILLFFGSKSIPSLARGLGKGIREFKEAADGIKREIEETAKSTEKVVDESFNPSIASEEKQKDETHLQNETKEESPNAVSDTVKRQ